LVFFESDAIPAEFVEFSNLALWQLIKRDNAKRFAKKNDLEFFYQGNGQGLVGAIGAIGYDFQDHTLELLSYRKKTKFRKGKGQLNDGQVFGCEFYPASELKKEVDAYVFLGQSNFHAAGIALSTNLPTYVLDPYFNEVREVTEFAQKLKKKATLAIYKAAEAKSFGVIVGLKEGQLSKVFALKIKKELEKEGKEVQLFALTDITNERLRNFKGIDAFIQVACPRISTDNQFDKPVLSTPQANALLKILRNESIEGYLEIPHWL